MFNMLVHCESLGCGIDQSLSKIHNTFRVEQTHPIGHVWA